MEAERCAWRKGCGETAAKIGRGKVRGWGRDWVVVAMVGVRSLVARFVVEVVCICCLVLMV